MPVDNILVRLWKTMTIPTLLSRAGINKRSGLPASDVIYLLLAWVWLKASSIHLFARDSLQGFAEARKDVIYDFLKREDINWRGFHLQTARKVLQDHPLNNGVRNNATSLTKQMIKDTVPTYTPTTPNFHCNHSIMALEKTGADRRGHDREHNAGLAVHLGPVFRTKIVTQRK